MFPQIIFNESGKDSEISDLTDKNKENIRTTDYVFCPNWQQKGPRVLVLIGSGWKSAMRNHYGITRKPFYSRDSLSIDPSTYPNGHPFGYSYTPELLIKEEMRLSDSQTVERIRHLMGLEIQSFNNSISSN